MAGFGPMKLASIAPEKSASIASVPALNVDGLERRRRAEGLLEQTGVDADDGGGVRHVGEVAEAQGHVRFRRGFGCRHGLGHGLSHGRRRVLRSGRGRFAVRRSGIGRRRIVVGSTRRGTEEEGGGEEGDECSSFDHVQQSTMWISIPQCDNYDFVSRVSASRARIRSVTNAPRSNEPADAPPRSGTQSIERAFSVLECLAASARPLGLTDIARAVDLNPSTTHRLIRALVVAGYVEQEPNSDHYQLGIGIAVIGQRALEHSGYHLARPILDDLSERTGESVSLGIRRGEEVVVIEQATSAAPLRFDHPTGAEIAMHASAMGKALLAFSVDDARPDRCGARTVRPLHRSDPHHDRAVDPGTPNVRDRGYATNIEERHIGVCGIAAPVRSQSGTAHAAVGIQGPSVRLTADASTNSRRS